MSQLTALAAPRQYQLFKQGAQTNIMITRIDYVDSVEKIIGNPKALKLRDLLVTGRATYH